MHFKAYAVDGVLLRTGSAYFSTAGLKRQATDLILIGPNAASRFEADFAVCGRRGSCAWLRAQSARPDA